MKGVVFNLLGEAVVGAFGEDAWDDLIEASGVDGAYTSLGDYADADVEALVAAAATGLSLTREGVLEWFGEAAMPLLRDRYPSLFEAHRSSRSFILSVNSIIHPEVRKLYAGATCPFFHFVEREGGAIEMRYRSNRRMFALARGFARGAAKLWGEALRFEEVDDASGTMVMSWA